MFSKTGISNEYLCAFANSIVAEEMLGFLSPTLNYQAGDILSMVLLDVSGEQITLVESYASLLGKISQFDWDSFETSWDFKRHPLL